jgi:branched-chain amino acid transport system permease protein
VKQDHNQVGDFQFASTWLGNKRRVSIFEYAFWLLTLSPFFLFPTYLSLASQIAIVGLFAISVDLILGYAGIITLGHAMFFGIGAYTAGILSKHGWGDPLTGLLASFLSASASGFLASFLVLRVHNLALLMVTLGLGLLTYEVANSLTWLTGGADGLRGIQVKPLLGIFEFDFYGYTGYAYSLFFLFTATVICRRIVNSPFGLSLRGIRENADRMAAIGSPSRSRLRTIYVFSAGLAGLSGAILAQTTQTISLDVLSFQRSADVVVMLILGGAGYLYGGLLGTMLFLIARDLLSTLNPQYWYFWIGVLLIVVVLYLPKGILGSLIVLYSRGRRSE